LGNACAMNNLGYIYQYGKGVETNIPRAIELYEKAVKLGNKTAMNNLKELCNQIINREKNPLVKIKYYDKLIELKDTETINKVFNNSDLSILYSVYKQNKELETRLNNRIDKLQNLVENLFYAPGMQGYYEAKESFEQKIKTNTCDRLD